MEVIEDDVAGEPQTGRKWVSQSLKKIQQALREEKGIKLSCETIRRLLKKEDIRPKSNIKRLYPTVHPDRDKQFQYISHQKSVFEQLGWPCISVDAKKKELVGSFYNRGSKWCRQAEAVNVYDFPSYAQGHAIPYGIYDLRYNLGYVAVGQSANTPEFAVDAIVWWWQQFGHQLYPDAPELLILADGGGSNGYRPRRWKEQLQLKLADTMGLAVTVCHYPTGASKWNPIEHRLFSQITNTWAATPLTSYPLILDALHSTKTSTGLHVEATLFETTYEKGLSVTNDDMNSLLLHKHVTCPNWNYSIYPRKTGSNF